MRILFLGAAYAQIPIITEARKRGYYVITCDYLPENPGHKYAHESYNVSTTDKDLVLQLAKDVGADIVYAYASDPAAPVAAYVCEQLGLPGNSYQSIQILSQKHLFREFLLENGFPAPKVVVFDVENDDVEKFNFLSFPYIIKPVDSSGSKGVRQVNMASELEDAIEYALSFSRKNFIIAEEFIDNERADIHGDGMVVDGVLEFVCLGDHIYNQKSNRFNPSGTLWPSQHTEVVKEIEQTVGAIIARSGFKNGPINIEARVNKKGELFIMEIGPRNGGHFVPQAIEYATGFNMVSAILDLLEGKRVEIPHYRTKPVAYYAIHSDYDGVLESLDLKAAIAPHVRQFHKYKKEGDPVARFTGSGAALGILILEFDSAEEMTFKMANMKDYIDLHIV